MNPAPAEHHEANRKFYDRISDAYDLLADANEKAARQAGVLSNLLGAIAGAWALDISPAIIKAGVTPYDPAAPLRND